MVDPRTWSSGILDDGNFMISLNVLELRRIIATAADDDESFCFLMLHDKPTSWSINGFEIVFKWYNDRFQSNEALRCCSM